MSEPAFTHVLVPRGMTIEQGDEMHPLHESATWIPVNRFYIGSRVQIGHTPIRRKIITKEENHET